MIMQMKEKHKIEYIHNEAMKHDLGYLDLLHATLCIEAKYKGEFLQEQFYAETIVNPHEKLWNEAYYCAIHRKRRKGDKWKYHTPRLRDMGIKEPSDEEHGGSYHDWVTHRNMEGEAQLLADRYNYFN